MTETIVVIKMRNMNASGSGHGEAGPIMSNVKEESLKERGGGGGRLTRCCQRGK